MTIKLNELVRRVDELPIFSQTINRIIVLADDPKTEIRDIGNEIMKDQGLTATLLRMANSPIYGVSRRINTVAEAAVLLGYKAIKNIAYASVVNKFVSRELPGYGLGREELWKQSQICAVTARLVAKKVKYNKPDAAYTAGLLCDIGKVILDYYLRAEYQTIVDRVKDENKTFLEVEQEVLGFDHGQVGAKIAEKWKLSEELVEAIACHHSPENAVIDPKMTAITHISNGILMMMGLHLGIDGLAYNISSNAMELLKLNEEMLYKIMSEVADISTNENTYINE